MALDTLLIHLRRDVCSSSRDLKVPVAGVQKLGGTDILVTLDHEAIGLGEAGRAQDSFREGIESDDLETVYVKGSELLCEQCDEGDEMGSASRVGRAEGKGRER